MRPCCGSLRLSKLRRGRDRDAGELPRRFKGHRDGARKVQLPRLRGNHGPSYGQLSFTGALIEGKRRDAPT